MQPIFIEKTSLAAVVIWSNFIPDIIIYEQRRLELMQCVLNLT